MAAIQDLDDRAFVPHEQGVRERRAVGAHQHICRLGHPKLLAEGK